MINYYALFVRRHRVAPRQFLIYVGREPMTMKSTVDDEDLKFRYRIIDLSEFDGAPSLASASLADNLLSLLCAHSDRTRALDIVLSRVAALPARKAAEAIEDLVILSELRRFQPNLLEVIKTMPITLNFRDSETAQQLLQEGLEEGLKEGRREGACRMVVNLLEGRFGPLDRSIAERIRRASVEELDQMILRASSISGPGEF